MNSTRDVGAHQTSTQGAGRHIPGTVAIASKVGRSTCYWVNLHLQAPCGSLVLGESCLWEVMSHLRKSQNLLEFRSVFHEQNFHVAYNTVSSIGRDPLTPSPPTCGTMITISQLVQMRDSEWEVVLLLKHSVLFLLSANDLRVVLSTENDQSDYICASFVDVSCLWSVRAL